MSQEIDQPGQELEIGIAYPIWTEEEVSTYFARLYDINNLFHPYYNPDFPYHFSSDPDALLKPFLFAGRQVITSLGTKRAEYLAGGSQTTIPYPEQTIPLLDSFDELSSQEFPVYFRFQPEGRYHDDLAGGMIKRWVTLFTILAGNGVSASGEVTVRSRLRGGDIESVEQWNPKQPIFIFPNDPQLICQTSIIFRENQQSLYREENPGGYRF